MNVKIKFNVVGSGGWFSLRIVGGPVWSQSEGTVSLHREAIQDLCSALRGGRGFVARSWFDDGQGGRELVETLRLSCTRSVAHIQLPLVGKVFQVPEPYGAGMILQELLDATDAL